MLYELKPSEFRSVRSLIDEHYPQFPIPLAVLEGRIPGKVWADDPIHPQTCLIATNFVFTFLAGHPDASTFREFLGILQKEPRSFRRKLECPRDFNPDFLEQVRTQGLEVSERCQFLYPKEQEPSIPEMPKEFALERITSEETFVQTQWGKLVFEPTYGTIANYLQNTFSVCLRREGKIIGEIHGMIGEHYILLGGIAHTDYRRQHLGLLGCQHFVASCFAQGNSPVFTCDTTNVASYGLAKKSGFQEDMRYEIVVLPPPAPALTITPAQPLLTSAANAPHSMLFQLPLGAAKDSHEEAPRCLAPQ